MYGSSGNNVPLRDKKKKNLPSGNTKKKGSYWVNSKNKKGSTTPIDNKKSHSVGMSTIGDMGNNWNNGILQNSFNNVQLNNYDYNSMGI